MKYIVFALLLDASLGFSQVVRPALPDAPYAVAAAPMAAVELAPGPAPAPRFRITKTTLGFLITDAFVRGEDAYTTHRGMELGYHEMTLSDGLAKNNAAMWTYSMGFVGANVWISYQLEKHGHRALARTISAADITLSGQQVLSNWGAIRRAQ